MKLKKIFQNIELYAYGLLGLASYGVTEYLHRPEVIYHDNAVFAKGSFDFSKVNDTNQKLVDFPTKIPGAGAVFKFITPGASKIGVMISSIDNRKSQYEMFKEVEEDNYNIISHLVDRYDISKGNGETLILRYLDLSSQAKEYLKSGTIADEADRESVMAVLDGFGHSALFRLYLEDRVELVKTESEAFYMISSYFFGDIDETLQKHGLDHPKSRDYIEIVADRREDYALENMVNNPYDIVILPFGAGHDFGGEKSKSGFVDHRRGSTKDNLYVWNQKNPDQKFSWIEIYPQTYFDYIMNHE